ncbi:Zona pellucida sperm-binding protein 3 [Merluccius polli]|uniref:Zona pellucida sperm-binding protein 3 n=1 Tax=Merluccius polli TaxID=89951 RepID=A0AA47NVX5_MERPO|nr:Zona pellucida sperm-binding protein 3 [Merluccius polli]
MKTQQYKVSVCGLQVLTVLRMKFPAKLLFLACSWLAATAQKPREAHKYNRPQGSNPQPSVQLTRQQPDPELLQQKQNIDAPLAWRFPEPPVQERNFPPEFSIREPPPPESVRVVCGEQVVHVEVDRDLLGVGQPILASDIRLGDCPPSEEQVEAQLLVFQYPLHGCGSQLRASHFSLLMTEETFIYQFTLHYVPSAVGSTPIIRTRDVSINVECHYPRQDLPAAERSQDVSSLDVKPTWAPFAATQAAEESLQFSLQLMTDDWRFERPSKQYFMGEQFNIEASVSQFYHTPLRVFVDGCVATLIPNTDTVPRYSFLDNYGCLMDGMLTGSSSQILPRVQDDKLHIQLEAFRFQQESNGVIYITCSLRAATVDNPVSATSKACSFSDGWREASGVHNSCSCCETSCGSAGPQAQTPGTETAIRGCWTWFKLDC